MTSLKIHMQAALVGLSLVMMPFANAQEMCTITGQTGVCQVLATAMGNTGCAPWTSARFSGACTNGKLEGPALLKRLQSDGKKVSHYLANFRQGVPDEPFISYFSEGIFVSLRNNVVADCVWFTESGSVAEDFRTKRKLCLLASSMFGSEILSNATYQAIRSDQFNVGSVVFSAQTMADDPKTVGRGAALR